MAFCLLTFISPDVFAGNKDRAGQAGATELLINPWARSTGLHGMNCSRVLGVEAMRMNVAGLTFTKKTEILISSTLWLQGSGVNVNALGFAQKIGDNSVIGLNMTALTVGEIDVTTVEDPEGLTGGTFRPQFFNLGVAYARSFSNSIRVGLLLRIVSESIANVSASGIALDMGIQYVTGPKDNIRFGISLRNIGTPLKFSGDGLAEILTAPSASGHNLTVNQRSDKFELPTVLNLGASYDFYFSEADKHRLSVMANFTSNAFSRDYIGGGLEYAFNEMFMVRGGYRYENGVTGDLGVNNRASAYTGFSGGVSVEVPFKKDGPALGIDYSYRHSNPFNGTHTIGVRINL